MGYTTEFEGSFEFDRPLDDETYEFLKKLATTRRMARKVDEDLYGPEGEFYVDGGGHAGSDYEDNVIDYNRPPGSQPYLWLEWIPTEDRRHLEWTGDETFCHYIKWLEYLIKKVFEPRGYRLNGEVEWYGEDRYDLGKIKVEDNKVTANKVTVEWRYDD